MNWSFFYIAATVLFKVAETYIAYASAEEKQEELVALNRDRAALQDRQAQLLNDERFRKLNVINRARIANLNVRASTGARTAESRFERGNIQAALSSLEGAENYLESTAGAAKNLRDNRLAIINKEGEPAGLASELLGGAAGLLAETSVSILKSGDQAKLPWDYFETANKPT
jgi:hypothetical protein